MNNAPPNDNNAELAAIACVLRYEDNLNLVPALQPRHFFDDRCRLYFQAMMDVRDAGERIEIHSCYYKVKQYDWALMFPEELNKFYGSEVGIVTHAKIIMDLAAKRDLILAARSIEASAYTSKGADVLLSEAGNLVKGVEVAGAEKDAERLDFVVQRVAKRVMNNEQAIEYLKTGIAAIDDCTSGVAKGMATFIAAPPSVGKSMLAANLIYNFARGGYKTLVFALEDLSDTLAVRMLSRVAQVDSRSILEANMNMDDYRKVSDVVSSFDDMPVWINDAVGTTPEKVRAAAIKAKNEHGLDCIIVDHMAEMVDFSDEYGSTSKNASQLRDIAKELNVAMIPLHQLNRSCVKEKRRPTMADLRGSGTIEAAARAIWFLHYPRMFDKMASENMIELVIAKNTHGRKGILELHMEQKYMYMGDDNGNVGY